MTCPLGILMSLPSLLRATDTIQSLQERDEKVKMWEMWFYLASSLSRHHERSSKLRMCSLLLLPFYLQRSHDQSAVLTEMQIQMCAHIHLWWAQCIKIYVYDKIKGHGDLLSVYIYLSISIYLMILRWLNWCVFFKLVNFYSSLYHWKGSDQLNEENQYLNSRTLLRSN